MKFLLLIFFFSVSLAHGQQEKPDVVVYFDFDRSSLTAEARSTLDQFVSGLGRNQQMNSIIIKGHCDAVGSDAYNNRLSEQRARRVHDYLLNQGLNKRRIQLVKGYGEQQPVAANETADERQMNRRVEIFAIQSQTDTMISVPHEREPVVDLSREEDLLQDQPEDSLPDISEQIITATEGQTLRLRNIHFYGGRHTFLPQSKTALDQLLRVMKEHPTLEIEIHGHICCRPGSTTDGFDFDTGDVALSVNRARAVYYFLAENGIDKRRMTFKGFAGTKPLIYPERTDADKTMNRRVEIRIVKK